jgi:tRNA(Ile)-lysidine synthase
METVPVKNHLVIYRKPAESHKVSKSYKFAKNHEPSEELELARSHKLGEEHELAESHKLTEVRELFEDHEFIEGQDWFMKSQADLRRLGPTADRLHDFEKALLARLKDLKGQSFLLAVSGGLDSVALLMAFHKLRIRLQARLAVASVDHGPSSHPSVALYRAEARRFVQKTVERLGLDFYPVQRKTKVELTTEDDLRVFRHECLESVRKEGAYDWLVLAHHWDDLLETRLIRMVRGTGPDGLAAMSERQTPLLRPLLSFSKERIERYARDSELNWLEDPSNRDVGPLRNWIRQIWLPQIEEKRPGARQSIGRSFGAIVESLQKTPDASLTCVSKSGIDRAIFNELEVAEKRLALARYLRTMGVRGFGKTHIEELLKRLKSQRKSFSFTLMKREWSVNAEQISVAE